MAELVTVCNAGDEPDSTTEIVVQNQVDYQPKASVIIPVYDVEKYLRQCLDSVLGQTLKEIEIICVDDGSTDKSLEILLEYAAKDKRISVIKQQNLFAGVARNAGLAVARGEFVLFLDSDDFFELNMLERMYNTAQKDGADVVVCGYSEFDDGVQKDVRKCCIAQDFVKSSPFSPEQKREGLNCINPSPWNKLFKVKLFREYDIRFENLHSCNDWTAVLSVLVMADKISVLEDLFVHYRINTKGQISANRGRNAKCILYAIDRLEKNLKRFGKREVFYDFLVKTSLRSLNYQRMCCNEGQLRDLECAIPEVLSVELCRYIERMKKNYVRRYYFLGLPVLKVEGVNDAWF